MPTIFTTAAFGLTASLAIVLAGCNGAATSTGSESSAPPATEAHDGHDHGEHAHAGEGPHHGKLIELGDDEFHAELLHDEQAGTVTIFVLDGAAAKQVPIEASEITINAKHDGTPEQFKLTADPDESDPEGRSSRFTSDDTALAAHLHEEGAAPRLVLTIKGKSYRGEIAHHHGHEGEHGHEHE